MVTVGFGSYAPDGSRRLAYPVILGQQDASPQLLQDVSDIITNTPNLDAIEPYSPETQALAPLTDLRHPTLLADYTSSCTAFTFDPDRGIICAPQAQPAGLVTDKGLFSLPDTIYGGGWGVFWSSFNPGDGLDD